MDVTVFGDELLKAYRGDLGISATKTDVTVTKDGVSYQAGRTLPIGTYTIVATPQGSATLSSLTVNGESFVSGDTISVIFGTNINITAVSEGGEPEPVTDLANTSWTYTVGDSYTLGKVSSTLVNLTISFKYNNIDYSLSSDSDLLFFGSGSFNGNFNIYKNDSVKYPRLRYYVSDGVQYCFTSLSDRINLPTGTVIRFDFGESTEGSRSDFLLQLVQTNFTRIE